MLKQRIEKQTELEFVSIEELVPSDHLLRQISLTIDFEFIWEKVRDLYCPDNGRPSLKPVVLFKMLFLGYLFGIRSARQLVKEIEVNVAYRRFMDSGIYQEIFDEIVLEAMGRGLVDGKMLYTDSTHLKASANKQRFEKQLASCSTRDYLSDLESDVNECISSDPFGQVR